MARRVPVTFSGMKTYDSGFHACEHVYIYRGRRHIGTFQYRHDDPSKCWEIIGTPRGPIRSRRHLYGVTGLRDAKKYVKKILH